jgi:hypothetical protein
MNASTSRDTRYELKFLHQGPNAFGLECTERGVHGSSPVRLEVHESLFTDEEMAQVHAVLAMLEEKFAAAHDAKETELGMHTAAIPRAKVHELVRQAEEARIAVKVAQLESARIEAENLLKREELAEFDRNLATIREAVGAP